MFGDFLPSAFLRELSQRLTYFSPSVVFVIFIFIINSTKSRKVLTIRSLWNFFHDFDWDSAFRNIHWTLRDFFTDLPSGKPHVFTKNIAVFCYCSHFVSHLFYSCRMDFSQEEKCYFYQIRKFASTIEITDRNVQVFKFWFTSDNFPQSYAPQLKA